MTRTAKLWLFGGIAVILTIVAISEFIASNQVQPPVQQAQTPPLVPAPAPVFQPKPKLTEIGIRPEDPHFCSKPDDAYYGQYGSTKPMPAGSGEFHNPNFLFDTKHRDNKVSWVSDFTGMVIVCFVVDVKGEPQNITFPSSPGPEMEQHITDHVSTWRYKPGWYNVNYRDTEPHIVPTEIAFDFTFK